MRHWTRHWIFTPTVLSGWRFFRNNTDAAATPSNRVHHRFSGKSKDFHLYYTLSDAWSRTNRYDTHSNNDDNNNTCIVQLQLPRTARTAAAFIIIIVNALGCPIRPPDREGHLMVVSSTVTSRRWHSDFTYLLLLFLLLLLVIIIIVATVTNDRCCRRRRLFRARGCIADRLE